MGLLDQMLAGQAAGATPAPDAEDRAADAVLQALLPVVLGMLADRRGPGAAAAVPEEAARQAPAVPAALGGVGGLAGLLARCSRHGQGTLASSWVLNGANTALTPGMVAELFTAQELREIAARAGVGEDEARRGLARLLPEVVDYFTPTGELPERDRLLERITDYEKRLPH